MDVKKLDPPVASLSLVSPGSTLEPTRLDASASSGRIAFWQVAWGDDSDDDVGKGHPGELAHQYAAAGEYVVTLLAYDQRRVPTSATLSVTVPIVYPPVVLDVPSDVHVIADAPTAVVFSAAASGGLNPTVTYDPPADFVFPFGETDVVVRAVSEDGQTASGSFSVTIVERLQVTCADAPVTVAEGTNPVDVVLPEPVITGGEAPYRTSVVPASPYPVGATTSVVLTVVSADGQTATCTFNVPVLQKPPDEPAADYFTTMATQPNCTAAYRFGSQAEIDAIAPPQKPYDPVLQKKRPIVYDPAEHAEMGTILPKEKTDTQQLYPALNVPPGASALIGWDMKLSPEFAYKGLGDMAQHKLQQFCGPGAAAGITVRGWYQRAAAENKPGDDWRIAEWALTQNNSNLCIPPRPSGDSNEVLRPRLQRFFLTASTWAWIVVHIADLGAVKESTAPMSDEQRTKWPDGRVWDVTYWMGDEHRDMALIAEHILQLWPYKSLAMMRFPEADSGQEQAPLGEEFCYLWQRGLWCLKNPTADQIARALGRPKA